MLTMMLWQAAVVTGLALITLGVVSDHGIVVASGVATLIGGLLLTQESNGG